MRRRCTLILLSLGLVLSTSVGNASLETDCYFEGGYFDAGYFGDDYFDETCTGGDPPSPVSTDRDPNLFGLGPWRR